VRLNLAPAPGRAEPAVSFLPAGTLTGIALPGLLSAERCRALVDELEGRGFAATGLAYPAGYRDNDRVVFDAPDLAAALFVLARTRLPDHLVIDGETWAIEGLNPRFRACRYTGGQSFCVHQDGPYVPSVDVRSWLTLQIYLNDSAGFRGGRTRFYRDADRAEPWAAIEPVRGTAIVFDHRAWHDGEAVHDGTKVVLRTDVLYRRADAALCGDGPSAHRTQAAAHTAGVVGRHRGYVWRVVACRDGALASSGRDGTIRRWPGGSVMDPTGGSAPRAFGFAPIDLGAGSVTALAEDEDGRLWCGLRAGQVAMLEASGPRHVATFDGSVLDLAALAGGGVAASLSTGHIVRISDTGEIRWSVPVHTGWAWSVAAHVDRIVSCGEDGAVVELDRDGVPAPLARLDQPARAIAALPDGDLVVGDIAGRMHRLASGGRTAACLEAHHAPVTSCAAGRGATWVSTGEDGRVVMWEHDRPIEAWTSPNFVRSAAVRRDGAIAWAGYDGVVRIRHPRRG